MEDKEAVYDEQIAPLMKQIIEICNANEIPMFATFQYSNDGLCTSMRYHGSDLLLFQSLDALFQSREGKGINIDKFMFWIMKKVKKTRHTSLILQQLGVPTNQIEDSTNDKEEKDSEAHGGKK